MLGEKEDDITIKSLKAGATIDVSKGPDTIMVPFNGKKPKQSKKFNSETLDKSWVLPAAAAEDMSAVNDDEDIFDTKLASSTSNTIRGGKKLALMLMSDNGHKVGNKPNSVPSHENTGMITPSLPGGRAMNNTRSKKIPVPNKANKDVKNKKYTNDASTRSSVKHKEVHVEKNTHTGKNNVSIQAIGANTADSAGFFFPTLLGASSSQPTLQMPNIGISGINETRTSNNDFF